MYKFSGIPQAYSDWASRFSSVRLNDAALLVLSLTLLILRGPFTSGACISLCFAARLASHYAVARSATRRPALSHILQKLEPLGEGFFLAFGFVWAGLAPSAGASIATLALVLTLLGFRLCSRAAHADRIAAAPLGAAIPILVLIAALRDQGSPASAMLLGAGVCGLSFLLFQAHRHLRRAKLESDFLAQALLQQNGAAHAVWRIDFRTRSLAGGEHFSGLTGRILRFSDIAADLFGVDEDDRDLAAAVFAPTHGRSRSLFIAHRARNADGRSLRLAHRALLQTGLMGRPLALACITSIAEHPAQMALSEQWKALRAHYGEAPGLDALDAAAPAPLSQERRARA